MSAGKAAAPSPSKAPPILVLAVPALGLAVLGVLAALFIWDRGLYLRVLTDWGAEPFRYPFLDWEAIGASIQCWQNGINVYQTNPCDVLGRTHNYSPLLLRLAFIPAGMFWRNVFGLGLSISFLLSLFVVFKPANWSEAGLFALATLSAMVVFALERGNLDVLFFLFFVAAGLWATGTIRYRLASYGLILFAGLLKIYPLVILLTALRERLRLFAGIAVLSLCAVLMLYFGYREEFRAMAQNIPSGNFDSNIFSASNLPTGLAASLASHFPNRLGGNSPALAIVIMALYALLVLLVAAQAAWIARNDDLSGAYRRLPARENAFLIIGATVIVGCFFAGQSISYRGVFLLFVVAGIVALRRAVNHGTTQAKLLGLLLIILYLMWNAAMRFWAAALHEPFSIHRILWFVRELFWWQLIAALAGMIALFASHSDTILAIRAWFAGRRPKHMSQS